jgi:hypothetical protein
MTISKPVSVPYGRQFDGEGEVKVYDFDGDKLQTSIGFFDMLFEIFASDHIRVVRRGDYAVVGYDSIETDATEPWVHDDGFGRIYTFERNAHDCRSALGLTSDNEPNVSNYANAASEEAILRTIKGMHAKYGRHGTIIGMEWEGRNGIGGDDYNIVIRTKKDKPVDYTARTYYDWEGGVRYQYVVAKGPAERVMDSGPIEYELWKQARLKGEEGDTYAFILRRSGDRLSVHIPWHELAFEDYARSWVAGIWVPNDCLLEDIEEKVTGKEPWDRVKELAEQAVETYNQWANGEVYIAVAEVFDRDQSQGNEFTTEDDEWGSGIHNAGCGDVYGYDDHLPEMIHEQMEEVLRYVKRLEDDRIT